jgi:hypothetical protein
VSDSENRRTNVEEKKRVTATKQNPYIFISSSYCNTTHSLWSNLPIFCYLAMNRTPAAEHSLVSQKKRCFHLDRVDFSSIENLLNSTYIKKTDNMMESQTDANTASRRLLCSLNTAECLTNMNSAFTPNLSSKNCSV